MADAMTTVGELVIAGAITATMASLKGRRPVAWFFIGALAPGVGLVLLLFLPDLEQKYLDHLRGEP